jgi:integrase/recombinase XerD
MSKNGQAADPQIADLVQAYLSDLEVRGYKPKTLSGYSTNLKTFARWAAETGAEQLSHFDADLAKSYIRHLHDKPRWSERHYKKVVNGVVAPAAIRNYVRDLKTFAAWLAEEQYTDENRLASVRLPKADETPIEPYTDDELARIFGCLNTADPFDLRDYVVLHTLWDTGMRVGELVALTQDELDLRHCEMRIQHAKFGKWRDIGFGQETQKYLTRYLTFNRPTPAIPGDRHVFLSLDGYPMQESTVQKICYRLSKRTGVHIHCHRFRHTFAVQMLRNGTDLRTLQRLMGHADIRILTRYLNLASEETVKTHQTNSPADRAHQTWQLGARRLPIRRGQELPR